MPFTLDLREAAAELLACLAMTAVALAAVLG